MIIEQGSTDVSVVVLMKSDASGEPTAGLTISQLTLHYWRTGGAGLVSSALTELPTPDLGDDHADNKAMEITGGPKGMYRLDLPDALFVSGADRAFAQVRSNAGTSVYSDVIELDLRKDIDGYDLEEAMRLLLAHACGERAGGGTSTITFDAADGSKTRVTMAVDAQGNSSTAPTLDAS